MRFRNRLNILLGLLSILLLGAIAATSFDFTDKRESKQEKIPVFSLDVEKMPLTEVCDLITDTTGYRISVAEAWRESLVSVHFTEVSLEEGLDRIKATLRKL